MSLEPSPVSVPCLLEHQLSGISHFCDMPFLIAWLMTREYTKPMLFCDKVFIFSKMHQVLFNNLISHMKVKYRDASITDPAAETICI